MRKSEQSRATNRKLVGLAVALLSLGMLSIGIAIGKASMDMNQDTPTAYLFAGFALVVGALGAASGAFPPSVEGHARD